MIQMHLTMVALEAKLEQLSQEQETSEIFVPVLETSDESQEEVYFPAVTPTHESLPTSPIKASETVIYDCWALTMANNIKVEENNIYFTYSVRSMSDSDRVFRYIKSGIALQDNLGNWYPFKLAGSGCELDPENLNLVMQLTVKAGRAVNIDQRDYTYCYYSESIPPFKGKMSLDTDYMMIIINNWGPFNGVVFHLDL